MGHHKHNTSIKSFIHGISKETKVIGKATKPLGHVIESGFHTAEHVMSAPLHELSSLGKEYDNSFGDWWSGGYLFINEEIEEFTLSNN